MVAVSGESNAVVVLPLYALYSTQRLKSEKPKKLHYVVSQRRVYLCYFAGASFTDIPIGIHKPLQQRYALTV
jgi:hypothetical protein